MSDKVALVTGANSGIGLEIARDLAKRGCRVLLGCRNLGKGKTARDDIALSTGNPSVEAYQLDLSSFESVRKLARALNKELKLDILVNNAGMMYSGSVPLSIDHYGLDIQLTTNYFGPFLLTNLLLPLLLKGNNSRIVFVSSSCYIIGDLNEKIMRGEIHQRGFMSYATSKLAVLSFAQQLSQRLEGTSITVNSVHPGIIKTDIVRHLNYFLRMGQWLFAPFILKNTVQGAQPVLYLAVDDELKEISGKYFDRFKRKDVHALRDTSASIKLWDLSLEITGLEWPL